MHARSALFDLYGDHLRSRGGQAPVAAVVRMLAPLDIAAPAVRTAISRMVRQGWLEPVRIDGVPGYRLTARAATWLDDAATRIYRTRDVGWRGAWDLLVLQPAPSRSVRERVRSGLGFLGYASLSDSTWISPFPSTELETVLDGDGATVVRFEAHDDDPAAQARRAWDLDRLATAYRDWHAQARRLVSTEEDLPELRTVTGDERDFAVRFRLVHEWRKFLFTDPGLPAELLPADWPGHVAAEFFAAEASRLLPAASRFVDRCLRPESGDTS